jgi:hypothetical protein
MYGSGMNFSLNYSGGQGVSIPKITPKQENPILEKKALDINEMKRLTHKNYAQNLICAEAICKKVRGFIPTGTNAEKDSSEELSFNEKVNCVLNTRTLTQQHQLCFSCEEKSRKPHSTNAIRDVSN